MRLDPNSDGIIVFIAENQPEADLLKPLGEHDWIEWINDDEAKGYGELWAEKGIIIDNLSPADLVVRPVENIRMF